MADNEDVDAQVDALATQAAALRLGSRSPALRLQIPNPFEWFRGGGQDEDEEKDDASMPSASPREDHRVRTAPALPQYPRYEGKTMQDRRDFMRRYETYLTAVNALQTNWDRAYAMPVGACIESRTKRMIARWVFNKQPHQVEEHEWIDYFRQANEPSHVDYAAVDAAMKALKMSTTLPEPESRMMMLQADMEAILDKFNLTEKAFDNEPRRLVQYMTAALAPPAFKSVIETRLTLQENKALKHDVIAFGAWVTRLLRDFLTWERAAVTAAGGSGSGRGGHGGNESGGSSRGGHGGTAAGGGAGSSGGGGGQNQTGGSRRRGGRGRGASGGDAPSAGGTNNTGAAARGTAAANGAAPVACLKCGSYDHRVRNCDNAKPGEAARLLKEARAQWASSKPVGARRVQADVQSRARGGDDRGTVDAVVDGVAVSGLLLDSGADRSLVARGVVDAIRLSGKTVVETKVPPVRLLPVGGREFEVVRSVRFAEVVLSTSAGPLMLRDLDCLVEEGNESLELTVGRPIMKLLGYSTDEFLVKARDVNPEWLLAGPVQRDARPEVEPTALERVCRLAVAARRDIALESEPTDAVKYEEVERHESLTATPELSQVSGVGEVADAIARAVEDATGLGLSPKGRLRVERIVARKIDSFRLQFGNDPPVRVAPLQVRLKPGAVPVKAQPRRYSPNDRAFLDRHTAKLLAAGLIYVNHRSRWASAPRIVRKREQDVDPNADPRMCVDLRGANERTEPMPWPMPVLEVVVGELEGARFFFVLDWFRGYWQLALHEESQEYFSFVTHRGIYTPTRVPMGATDAVAYCQGVVEEVFGDLMGNGILAWLDDILGYSDTEEGLLDILEKVLDRCAKYGLKLHAGKCKFFMKEAKWCGKVFSAEGVKHCPDRVQGLVDLQPPSTGAELQQLLCAVNWMRQSIPEYARITGRLYDALERAAKKAGSRKKTRLAKVQLRDVGWGEEEVEDVEAVRQALLRMVPLAHPSPTADLCLYTDASQDYWGAVLTQLEPGQLQLPLDEQAHRPLAFLSGRFAGAAARWATIEKEAFAIVESTRRLEYLLLRPGGFRLYTDHRNLVFIFDPFAHDTAIARYQADKLQRWALSLMAFRYVIEHVPGEQNAWGDLLSRWGAGQSLQDERSTTRVSRLAVVERVSPLQEADFVWPSEREIRDVQRAAFDDASVVGGDQVVWDDDRDLAVTAKGQVWIPSTATDLQQRLCIVAHAGASGHRGASTTTTALVELFWWRSLREDVSTFVSECFHCMATAGGRIPRPFGETLRATKPNELLHFDFLSMVESEQGVKYVLVLKDGMSGFVELVPCVQAGADQVYQGLLDWFKRFGVVTQWVSDQGTHFKNEVMARLQHALGAHHHFTTAYTPWANGTVEVVNREVLKAVKALLSERRLEIRDWPAVLPVVQAALNAMPADRLGGATPLTAFTALPGGTQLRSILHPREPVDAPVEWVQGETTKHLEAVRVALDAMHHEMVESSEKRRRAARERHARAKGVRLHKFSEGDFVLAATATGRSGNKLAVVWRGPKRVLKALNDYTFEVQDMTAPFAVTIKHASRLQLYREAARGVAEELLEQAIHGDGGHLVEALLACRVSPESQRWEVQVKWFGLDDVESSWEPAETLKQDVPVLFQRFIDAVPSDAARQQMAAALDATAGHAAAPEPRVPRTRRGARAPSRRGARAPSRRGARAPSRRPRTVPRGQVRNE